MHQAWRHWRKWKQDLRVTISGSWAMHGMRSTFTSTIFSESTFSKSPQKRKGSRSEKQQWLGWGKKRIKESEDYKMARLRDKILEKAYIQTSSKMLYTDPLQATSSAYKQWVSIKQSRKKKKTLGS